LGCRETRGGGYLPGTPHHPLTPLPLTNEAPPAMNPRFKHHKDTPNDEHQAAAASTAVSHCSQGGQQWHSMKECWEAPMTHRRSEHLFAGWMGSGNGQQRQSMPTDQAAPTRARTTLPRRRRVVPPSLLRATARRVDTGC
jgi:hypothetical protein